MEYTENAVKSLRYKSDNGTEMVRFFDEDVNEYVEIEAEKFDKKGKKVMEVTNHYFDAETKQLN